MQVAYLMEWEESERGWGTRPDGWSLHLTPEDYQAYLTRYAAQLPKEVQHEYSRPVSLDGRVTPVEVVDDGLFRLLKQQKSLRFFTNDLHVKTEVTGRRVVSSKPLDAERTFIDLCLAKETTPEAIGDFVNQWRITKTEGQTLQSRLGMTHAEFREWEQNPQSLYAILFARVMAKNPQPQYARHKKSGGSYVVLLQGRLESTTEPVTVYQGLDGQVWVRSSAEFEDGRFEPLAS